MVRSAVQLSAAVHCCLAVSSALAPPCKSSCAPSTVCVSSCVSCGVGGFSGCFGSAVNADAGAAEGDSAENAPGPPEETQEAVKEVSPPES